MKKDLSFITVIGKDQKGIVAKISDLLYKNNINIEDISQKVIACGGGANACSCHQFY